MSLTSSSFTMMCLSVDVFLFILTGMHRTSWSIYVCFIYNAKASDYVNHNKLENSSRDGNTRHLTCFLRNLYAGQEATVRTGHGTTDWFQIGKGVRQGCILSPMPGWLKQKLESRLPGEVCRWHHPCGRKWTRTKEPLLSHRGEWKSWLKTQHSEN